MKTKKKPKAVLAWGVCDEEGIYRAYVRKEDAAEEAAWDYTERSVVIRVRIVPVAKKARKVKP